MRRHSVAIALLAAIILIVGPALVPQPGAAKDKKGITKNKPFEIRALILSKRWGRITVNELEPQLDSRKSRGKGRIIVNEGEFRVDSHTRIYGPGRPRKRLSLKTLAVPCEAVIKYYPPKEEKKYLTAKEIRVIQYLPLASSRMPGRD